MPLRPTYLQFHLAVVVPAVMFLVATAVVFRHRAARPTVWPTTGGRFWRGVGIITVLALGYTIPWDNYLVARGVWTYGEGRVLATLWHAPVEEYLFILVQPTLTALWLAQLSLRDWPLDDLAIRPRVLGGLAGVAVGIAGWWLLAADSTFYLGAIVLWAAPVLALQWAVGLPQLLVQWRTVALGVAVPTLYLWLADRIALHTGIWILSEQYTTGIAPLGLPIEEATFFLVTNLFVVQGLVLYRWLEDRYGTSLALVRPE
jgi:lycopene cyclase domain-containing protein